MQLKAAEVLCGINTDIYEFKNLVKQKLYDKGNIQLLCRCAFEVTDKIMVCDAGERALRFWRLVGT